MLAGWINTSKVMCMNMHVPFRLGRWITGLVDCCKLLWTNHEDVSVTALGVHEWTVEPKTS